jgi:phosphoribosyl 1,2-cyclic phosphodiesterase
LASGSTGNATLVKSDEAYVLFDAGLSMRYIRGCLDKLKIDAKSLDGIFLSHEHSDHINGAGVISRNMGIPLWSNNGTWEAAKTRIGHVHRHELFTTERAVTIKDLEILPVPVSHDATEPVCFRILHKQSGVQIGIVTDIGILTPPVKHYLQNSNLIMLESNYDLDMLVSGVYPENVKLFIMGELGHLSNMDAGESLTELIGNKTEHVLLSHISMDNNTLKLAHDTVAKVIGRNGFDSSMLHLTYHNKMSEEFSF